MASSIPNTLTGDPAENSRPTVTTPIQELQLSSDVEDNENQDEPLDGGYGWVIVACVFAINTVTWGMNTSYGVYISYYIAHDSFADATYLRYAFVGGVGPAFAYFLAPTVNYLTKTFGIRIPLVLGMFAIVLGQCLAGLSTKFSTLLVSQGLLFGLGLGLTQGPSQPILPQWFDKRLSVAQGLATCGSGFGGLIFSNTTRAALESLGVKYSLILNGCISAMVLAPSITLLKQRNMATKPKTEPLQLKWLLHEKFSWVWTWGASGAMGYFIALYSLAPFATDGLGLSQKEGAALQSILAAGQVIGRPLIGLAMDKGGRANMATFANIMSAMSCFAFWLPARSFGLLAVFSIVQGAFGGTVICVNAPLATSAVGVMDVGSALAIFWLAMVLPVAFAQPVAVALIDYSHSKLHREGPDLYSISIGLCGGLFCLSAALSFGLKCVIQGKPAVFQRT